MEYNADIIPKSTITAKAIIQDIETLLLSALNTPPIPIIGA